MRVRLPPTHRFPDDGAHLLRLRLFQRHLRSLVWVWVWVLDWVHTSPRTLLHMLPFFLPPSFHTISAHALLSANSVSVPVLTRGSTTAHCGDYPFSRHRKIRGHSVCMLLGTYVHIPKGIDCVLHSGIMGDQIITLDLGRVNVNVLEIPIQICDVPGFRVGADLRIFTLGVAQCHVPPDQWR